MSVKARIGLLVESQGTRRTASDVDRVAKSVDHVGDEAARTGRKMRAARAGATSLMGGLKGLATATTYGAAAAVGIGVAFGVKAVGAWEESRKVAADTAQVIKSTGGAAHITANQVAELAGSISGKTGIDDEAIQSGANMLLTFKNIRNEAGKGNKVFTQSVGVLADLAVKLGRDPKSAAIMLGKALNDPIAGVTALGRAGVQLDASQKKQIKSMVEQGNLMGAQKLLIGELTSQVGGQAKAQGTALDKLKVSWGNIEEAVGSGLQPVTDVLFTKLKDGLDEVTPLVETMGKDFSRIFGRDDLDFGQKLGMSARKAQRRVRPIAKEWGDEFKKLLGDEDLGDALGNAFDKAAPVIANHAATAAPRVAGAFVHAWLGANIWGKLITVAFLAGKLGAFRTLGGMAAGKFAGNFSTSVGPQLDARKSKMNTRLGSFGTWAGKAVGAAMAYQIAHSIAMDVPALSQYSGSQGWGELWRDIKDFVPGEDSEARRARRKAEAELQGRIGPGTSDPLNPGNGLGQTPGAKHGKSRLMQPPPLAEPVSLGASLSSSTNGTAGMRIHRADLDHLANRIIDGINDKRVILGNDDVTRVVHRAARRDAATRAGA